MDRREFLARLALAAGTVASPLLVGEAYAGLQGRPLQDEHAQRLHLKKMFDAIDDTRPLESEPFVEGPAHMRATKTAIKELIRVVAAMQGVDL